MSSDDPIAAWQTDLEWLAFCYIADELDETAREQFESRLEKDQVAREFVAAAVEHNQLIFAALTVTASPVAELVSRNSVPPDFTSHSRKSVSKISAGAFLAVVSVVVALGWLVIGRLTVNQHDRPAIARADLDTTTSVESSNDLIDGDRSIFGSLDDGADEKLTSTSIAADRLAVAWAESLAESDASRAPEFLALDDHDSTYSDVVFEDETWLSEAVLEFDGGSPSNRPANSADSESESDNRSGGI